MTDDDRSSEQNGSRDPMGPQSARPGAEVRSEPITQPGSITQPIAGAVAGGDHGGVAPGWYAAAPDVERWWDGTAWTEHTRAAGGSGDADQMTGGMPVPQAGRTNWRVLGPILGGVVVIVVVLAVVLALAVGGDKASDAPRDASTEDFCEAMSEVYGLLFVLAFQESDAQFETGRAVEVLSDTGTPENLSDEARAGFEELIEGLEAADGRTRGELEESGDVDTDGDESNDSPESDAFEDYTNETCDLGFG